MTKPFVKWVGGKRQLLPKLRELAPNEYERYVEPMLGGGAVFFDLEPKLALIADTNPDLVNAYVQVRDQPNQLITELESLQVDYRQEGETAYYRAREDFNRKGLLDELARAAHMIFLNRTCFNGLWRVNKKGEFNVPKGKFAKPPDVVRANTIRAASRTLYSSNAEISCQDFETTLGKAVVGDFVYIDPPYQPVSPTADFTSFTKEGFGEEDQTRLAECVHDLVDRGAYVLVSNSDHPTIRELYGRYAMIQVMARRAVNSKASARGPVSELIIVAGFDPPEGVEVL